MPDAVQVAVGKAVASYIAGATLSQEVTVERSYADWDLKLESMDLLELQRDSDKLRIDVVVHTTLQETQQVTRGSIDFVVPVDIAIRRKLGNDKQDDTTGRIKIEELDKLIAVVEEVHLLFRRESAGVFAYEIWDAPNGGVNLLACPHAAHLRQPRQFTGLLRIYFLATVAL